MPDVTPPHASHPDAPPSSAPLVADSNTAPSRKPNLIFGALILSALLFAATAWWLLRAKSGLGRENWFIKPQPAPWPWQAWLLPLGTLFIFGGLSALSVYDRFKRAKTRREQIVSLRLSVGALCLLSLLWPWTLIGPGDLQHPGAFTLVSTLWSDLSNQYFATSYEINDARDFSRTYPQRQHPTSRIMAHVATHPPGATLFFYGARRVFESVPPLQNAFETLGHALIVWPTSGDWTNQTQLKLNEDRGIAARSAGLPAAADLPASAIGAALWCAWLLSACGALTVPAIYALASLDDAGGDVATREARGLIAAALWVLAPSVGLFGFSLDLLLACLGAWALFFAAKRLNGGGRNWMIASGALWALASWISIGALAVGVIIVVAIGVRGRARPYVEMAWLGAGFVAGWLLLLALFPMPLEVFDNAMRAHHFATLESRSRWGWVALNVWIFALFAGWIVGVGIAVVWARKWNRAQDVPLVERLPGRPTGVAIGIAALIVMLGLSVSGNVRGEVERLWLFLLPPLCVLAARGWSAGHSQSNAWNARSVGVVILALSLQAAQTLLMAATLAPLVLPFG